MDKQSTQVQDTEHPATAHRRFGRFRRARAAHPAGEPRRTRSGAATLRRYAWYAAAALTIYLASLAYAKYMDEASHAYVRASNTR